MAPDDPYSSLEVVPEKHLSEDVYAGKIVVNPAAETAIPPLPESESGHDDGSGSERSKGSGEHPDPGPPTKRRKIGGLAPQLFWALVAAVSVLLLMAAVAGAVIASRQGQATGTTSEHSTTSSLSGQEKTADPTSSPTSTSSLTVSATAEVGASATLYRDCPSSNNTIYNAMGSSDYQFRKLCSARYPGNGKVVVNKKAASLNDCIDLCASYNTQNKDAIADGGVNVCNAVCWRHSLSSDLPGQCFATTYTNTSSSALPQDFTSTECDSGAWINRVYIPWFLYAWAFLLGLNSLAAASSFPPEPTGLTTLISQKWPGASISYKQTTVCETTPGVKAWSGYVSLPGTLLNKIKDVHGALDANMFFWYFESRNDSATSPTAIYLGGGPGYTSLDPTSGFPCNINADSNSTTLNPFSWNNNVNMLYIEQPVGTGFSYQTRVNGTLNVRTGEFTPVLDGSIPNTNDTILAATLDPRPLSTTVNTTLQAGRTMWQFAQVFFQEFPEHKTSKPEISIWGNSYGGYWSANFVDYFLAQNQLIETQSHPNPNATVVPISTLGIGNGCIDARAQALSYPLIANNNTYGIKVYSDSVYEQAMGNVTAPQVGCYDLIDNCRALAAEGDPSGQANNETVNTACQAAAGVCVSAVLLPIVTETNRSKFDIAQVNILNDVDSYFNGFYNQRWVQEDLGARVNFSQNNVMMQQAMFAMTGDAVIRDLTPLERAVSSGVNLALVYGDRDYQCNWIGAENISLVMEYPGASSFRSAGYANIETNSSYTGGLVRQHGNVSFSRLFDAGHAFTFFQPETAYQIFQRSMFGLDVATGKQQISDSYSSAGSQDTLAVTNKAPASTANVCYTYIASDVCTPEQIDALESGTAVVHDFVVVEPRGVQLAADGSVVPADAISNPGSNTASSTPSNGASSGVSIRILTPIVAVLASVFVLGS